MSRDILELGASLGFLDELYERQVAEPGAIDPSWQGLIGPVPTQTKANGRLRSRERSIRAGRG